MQHDQQRIMIRADFDSAVGQEAFRVSAGNNQLSKSLQRDEEEQGGCPGLGRVHASRIWKPALNPGPSAVIMCRPERPRRSMRCSTNNTVTADMLPCSRNT